MREEIFRKKSIDKMKSPESLDEYIKVSNPGVWLLLLSVIILLAGACVWGIYGHIDSTVPASVRVENGKIVCAVAEENIKGITVGMTVQYGDGKAVIENIGEKENGEYICTLKADEVPTDGFYGGKIITKSYKPLSFVLN